MVQPEVWCNHFSPTGLRSHLHTASEYLLLSPLVQMIDRCRKFVLQGPGLMPLPCLLLLALQSGVRQGAQPGKALQRLRRGVRDQWQLRQCLDRA